MSDVLDRYRALANDFSRRVEAAGGAGSWGRPSPCDEWTARDVVAHVIWVHRYFLELLDGEPGASASDDDVVQGWAGARTAVESALADPDRSRRPLETPFGTMPYEAFVGQFMSMDLLVHTWDLSRATGQDERLDADAVATYYEAFRPMDAKLRGPGFYKAKVTPAPGADLQTQFLCFLGRDVAIEPLLLP